MVLSLSKSSTWVLYILTTAFPAIHAVRPYETFKKCCKSFEILTEINSTYRCVENKSKRLGVLINETNFLETSSDGQCVDINTDIFIFNVNDRKIVSKRPVTTKPFAKCCPLGYSYNSVLHSCEENHLSAEDYIKEYYVRVGLPSCNLIVDYELNETRETYHDIIDNIFQNQDYCIDVNEKGLFTLRLCKENIDFCDGLRCIKKCCPDGQSFINRSQCFDTYTHGLNLSSLAMVEKPLEHFAIISNRSCKIYMMKKDKYIFNLDDKGVFRYWSNLTGSYIYNDVKNTNSYCIEHVKMKNYEGYAFFMCFAKIIKPQKMEYTLWPKVFSCIFLLLTILVYVILRETKKVFGQILMNYCLALFLGNALLTYAQQSLYPTKIDCLLRGYFLLFLTTASYSWSNVVCYDIWQTFGSTKKTTGQYYRRRTWKKLVPYLIYGWGAPLIMTLLVLAFNVYKVLPDTLQPILGEVKCFLENRRGNYGNIIFLNLPELIMQLVNTIFFIKTVVYCTKVKKEINRINDTTQDDENKRFQRDKERLFLILKLSVIMGISFLFQVVSLFFDMKNMGDILKYVEIVWDIINCLQGVFIFIIFICKKKVLDELLKKVNVFLPRKPSSSSLYTQTTILSSGNSKKGVDKNG